jgi:hypothetical protein
MGFIAAAEARSDLHSYINAMNSRNESRIIDAANGDVSESIYGELQRAGKSAAVSAFTKNWSPGDGAVDVTDAENALHALGHGPERWELAAGISALSLGAIGTTVYFARKGSSHPAEHLSQTTAKAGHRVNGLELGIGLVGLVGGASSMVRGHGILGAISIVAGASLLATSGVFRP